MTRMPIFAVGIDVPQVAPDCFIAPTATVVGKVTILAGASVWYGAVVRGDTSTVVIEEGANVQDGAVVHSRAGDPTVIGASASIGHNCVVHGARIGARALIGNGAIVLDGAEVGEEALVAAGSVVLGNAVIPPRVLAAGAPAVVKRPIEGTPSEDWVRDNPLRYARLAAEHAAGLRLVSPPTDAAATGDR